MTTTPNLGLTHLEAGTSSPEVVTNAIDDGLDHAMNSHLVINFASDADYTLSTTGSVPQEWQNGTIEFTDTGVVLTTGRNVIVPTNERVYRIVNSTAQTLTVKTSAGTGIAVATNTGALLQCDGTNVIDALPGIGSGITSVVEDTTPQLGGQLDVNGNALGDGTLELLSFTETGSAVNQLNITNAATGNAPSLGVAGDDTNIDLNLTGKGTGQVQISGAYKLPASDGTNGQALVTDGAGGVTFGAPAASASVLNMPTLSKSGAYTVVTGDHGYLIEADATSAGFTITLPAAATAGDGFTVGVKKIDSTANTVTIDGSGAETIDGAATVSTSTQWDIYVLQCNGTSWNVFVQPAGAATDTNAIHDNTASEISALTEVEPAVGDWAIIEDASDSNNKKKIDIGKVATECFAVACSDETTALTTGTAKATFRMPYAFTVTEVRASLTGAGSTSGTTTIDINESGVSILSTKLTIDFGEKTSETAATAAVISDSALADDAEITIDIDAVTGGADETGLKIYIIGVPT